MVLQDSVLYEEFVDARRVAVELTDRYRETSADDPSRPELWERVVRQTETARLLLEKWLQFGKLADDAHSDLSRVQRHLEVPLVSPR